MTRARQISLLSLILCMITMASAPMAQALSPAPASTYLCSFSLRSVAIDAECEKAVRTAFEQWRSVNIRNAEWRRASHYAALPLSRINVQGFSADDGLSEDARQSLSLARANTIGRALVRAGFPPESIWFNGISNYETIVQTWGNPRIGRVTFWFGPS